MALFSAKIKFTIFLLLKKLQAMTKLPDKKLLSSGQVDLSLERSRQCYGAGSGAGSAFLDIFWGGAGAGAEICLICGAGADLYF